MKRIFTSFLSERFGRFQNIQTFVKGFTLVEILLVIAVSSILFASGISLLNPTFQLNRGNDARRKADLLKIQSGLEQYFADAGDYPGSVGWCSQISDPTRQQVKQALGSYMTKMPQDPKYAGTTKDYYYWHYEVGQYRLYSVLDNTNDTAVSTQALINDTPTNCANTNIAYNYKGDSSAPLGPTSTITLTPTNTFTPTPVPPPSIQLLANSIFPSGVTANLSYVVSDAASCTGSNGTAAWRGNTFGLPSGSKTTGAMPITDTIFTLGCTGIGGSNSVDVTQTIINGILSDSFISTFVPSLGTADATSGVKTTHLRTRTSFSLKGFGFYVEGGSGSYTWSVYTGLGRQTLVGSGTTGVLPDTNNFYYAKFPTAIAIGTNNEVYFDVTLPSSNPGTARYTTSSSNLDTTTLALTWNYSKNGASETTGAYAIKIVY